MKIGVIGAGYVGTATAVGLSLRGNRVVCVERDRTRLRELIAGNAMGEPGMAEGIRRGLEAGTLSFTDDPGDLAGVEVVMVAVGTPQGPDGRPELGQLEGAVATARREAPGALVVIRSTVPPGTARRLGAASNPEFLREGHALRDFLNPHRIVIGADDPGHAQTLLEVYREFEAPKVVVDTATAELSKYASNLFLALKVSYANLVADLARELGAKGKKALQIAGMDPRIGPHYLSPGLGWGGSCLPKDLAAAVWMAREAGLSPDLLVAAERVNRARVELVLEILGRELGGLDGKRVALWGLSFKAGTGDTRESQAVKLALALTRAGALVKAHDPVARVEGLPSAKDPLSAVEGAHALVVATDWPVYRDIDPGLVKERMEGNLVLDARGILPDELYRSQGLRLILLDEPAP